MKEKQIDILVEVALFVSKRLLDEGVISYQTFTITESRLLKQKLNYS